MNQGKSFPETLSAFGRIPELIATGERRYPKFGEKYCYIDDTGTVSGPWEVKTQDEIHPFGANRAHTWSYPPENFMIYQLAETITYRTYEFKVRMRIRFDDQTDPADMVDIIKDVLNNRDSAALDWHQNNKDLIEEYKPTFTIMEVPFP